MVSQLGRKYFKELKEYQDMLRTRDWRITSLKDKISDLTGNLEHSCLLHRATEAALDHASEEYGQIFDEKETLILEGIK